MTRPRRRGRSGSSCPGSGGGARRRRGRSLRRRARTTGAANAARDLDDLGHARGDVVEVAGEHAHLVAVRGAPGCARRRASTRPTRVPVAASASATRAALAASIGCTGRSTSSRTSASAAAPPASARRAVSARSPPSIAARRTASAGTSRGAGDRVGHQPGERALAQLAGEQAHDEVGLGGGRTREELARASPGAPPPIPGRWSRRSRSSASSSSATVTVGGSRTARVVARASTASPSRRRCGPGAARP